MTKNNHPPIIISLLCSLPVLPQKYPQAGQDAQMSKQNSLYASNRDYSSCEHKTNPFSETCRVENIPLNGMQPE